MTRVIVCVGGGGVGKTSTSAAIALALAHSGHRTLIVTIDPARRLAGAMGVTISDEVTTVPLPEGTRGTLSALMPDPHRSMRTFIDYLFETEPAAKERMLRNPLYIGLSDAAPGIHELVAMNLVANAAAPKKGGNGVFDVIVIDTAPSRHAIDFVTYPARLSALLGGRVVTWLAGITRRGDAPTSGPRSWFARATAPIENLLAKVTGPNLLRDTAAMFSDLALVRGRFVDLTARASELLLGDRVNYLLVAAPTAAARDDVLFLAGRLEKLGRRAHAVILNRAAAPPGDWLHDLTRETALPHVVTEVLGHLHHEYLARARAAEEHAADYSRQLPKAPVVRLPHIEATAPDVVVAHLADALAPHLAALLPK